MDSTSITAYEADVPVILSVENSGIQSWKPQSVFSLLKESADDFPDHSALKIKVDDKIRYVISILYENCSWKM